MIITCTTRIEDILKADEFKDYVFNIDRVTGISRLLEYVIMDNKTFKLYLDEEGLMVAKEI